VKTPERTAKAMSFLTKGYQEDPEEILRGALFDVDYDEMVIVRDIESFPCASITCCPSSARSMSPTSPRGR